MGAMFFGQYLLSKGIIDRDALIDGIELQRKKNLSLTALAVRRGYLESKDEEAILLRYRTSDADLEELCTFDEDSDALVDGRRRYAQKLVGDRELFVALDLEPEMAAVVAEGLIGMPLPAGSEAAIDAVCECVNIIGGNACTRLEASGLRLRPEPPFSTEGSEPADGSGFIARAQVIAGEAEMDVRVFL